MPDSRQEQVIGQLMDEYGLSREQAQFGAGFVVELEKRAANKQPDHLNPLREALARVAQLNTRMLEVLQRTTYTGSLSEQGARLLDDLTDLARAHMHDFGRLADEFFNWHNEAMRLARSRQ